MGARGASPVEWDTLADLATFGICTYSFTNGREQVDDFVVVWIVGLELLLVLVYEVRVERAAVESLVVVVVATGDGAVDAREVDGFVPDAVSPFPRRYPLD